MTDCAFSEMLISDLICLISKNRICFSPLNSSSRQCERRSQRCVNQFHAAQNCSLKDWKSKTAGEGNRATDSTERSIDCAARSTFSTSTCQRAVTHCDCVGGAQRRVSYRQTESCHLSRLWQVWRAPRRLIGANVLSTFAKCLLLLFAPSCSSVGRLAVCCQILVLVLSEILPA